MSHEWEEGKLTDRDCLEIERQQTEIESERHTAVRATLTDRGKG